MKTKICTDIKQSQKLIKIGLDPKTADMFWRDWRRETELITIPCVGWGNEKEDLPAWSLSALLELMPILLKGYWRWILTRHNGGYSCTYLNGGETFHSEGGNTDIDAAYNMVIYLLEQGYIKTEKK